MQRGILVAIAVAVTACVPPSAPKVRLKAAAVPSLPNGYTPHEAPDKAFQIAVPTSWTVNEATQRIGDKAAAEAAGAAMFGEGERSSLVAKKMDGLACLKIDEPGSGRIMLAACRMTLYDPAKYEQFRSESFDGLATSLQAGGAKPTQSKRELPVGTADVMEAIWKYQGFDVLLRSYFLRDAKDVVYELDFCSMSPPGHALFDETPVIETFRPGP